MPKYSRERIITIFDKKAVSTKPNQDNAKTDESLIQISGEIVVKRLKLTNKDTLLDVGTGTGDKAIIAARICQKVIGIDISKKSLDLAREKAKKEKLKSVTFLYGSLEDPNPKHNFAFNGITKILLFYSLHHLPNQLKKKSLNILIKLLSRPGRIVIGDIMFFEDPSLHRDEFAEVLYDAGDTDFPSKAEYLVKLLVIAGGTVQIEQIHPLVGVITADFR